MKRKYTIGLDIGTNSVGFVAIDEKMKILKYNNRFAFGTHEFVGAETAEATRLKRGGRRRYNRRKKRIQLIQELFKEHLETQSFFSSKEKNHFWRNSNDFENRTLSETIAKLRLKQSRYPTIYHLRNELITSGEKSDLRLVYLAIHNLVKYRGHFLQQGEWGSKSSSEPISQQLEDLVEYYNQEHRNNELVIDSINYRELEVILKNQQFNRKEKLEEIQKVISIKGLEEVFKLLVGLTSSLDKLFINSDDLEIKAKKKFSFLKNEIEDSLEFLTDEEQTFFELITPIYQGVQMFDLLKGNKYVAAAKVKSFKQYREDLDTLQKIFNSYLDEEDYRAMFLSGKKEMKEYRLKPNAANRTKLASFDRYLLDSKYEDEFFDKLIKKLKMIVEPIKDTVDGKEILAVIVRVEDREFLKKLKTKQNAAIPYQNNLYEVEQILKNQQKYYDFIDEEFITKVKQVISFRIPYYIGPLTKGGEEKFGWVVRNNLSESVTPFNFEQIINKSESAERFIRRMTNKCTYLKTEDVVPKASLLYEEYELLNELNVIQIRQEIDDKNPKYRLSLEEKNWVIEHVFMKNKTVKVKRLIAELKKSPFDRFKTDEELHVYGTQKEDQFATSLSMHIDMYKIFGEDLFKETAMIEEIIEWLTIFEERDIFRIKVKEKYPNLIEETVEQLIRIKPTGWGRFSAKLLDELPIVDFKTGEKATIIHHLRASSHNFMELMSETDLKEKVSKMQSQNQNELKKIKYSDVAELPGSPALKRGIWHAVKIVEELATIFGEPANIVIEVARSDDKKQRSVQRKDLLKEYQAKARLEKDVDLEQFLKKQNAIKNIRLDKERVWLYITQQGKCLYSGEPLDPHNLEQYEVDHILPRNFVKDNSVSNKALVKKVYNQNKAGDKTALQVIPTEKQAQLKLMWRKLESIGLISRKKYEALMKPYLSNEDKEGFIARQLVETRQIIKNIALLLEERFENSSIHAVKAGIISNFRQMLQMPKIRNINNKHHAMDALYSATFIQMILNQYGYNFLEFTMEKQALYDKWNRAAQKGKDYFLFEKMKQLPFPSHISDKELSAFEYYKEVFEKVEWNTTKQKRYGDSMFYNETIYSPKGNEPTYESDKHKIGVHSGLKKRCSWVISYVEVAKNGKEKEIYKIQDIQTIDYQQAKQKGLSMKQLVEHIIRRDNKKNIDKIELIYELQNYHKVIENGQPYYFISSSERHVGKQFELELNILNAIRKITEKNEKYAEIPSNESLRELFSKVKECFYIQYPYFEQSGFKEKVEKYNDSINTLEEFQKGLEELYKAAQNSGTRSDVFGSRLTKQFDVENLYVLEESITGLLYKKPKKIKK